jgi:hypothetical protein
MASMQITWHMPSAYLDIFLNWTVDCHLETTPVALVPLEYGYTSRLSDKSGKVVPTLLFELDDRCCRLRHGSGNQPRILAPVILETL